MRNKKAKHKERRRHVRNYLENKKISTSGSDRGSEEFLIDVSEQGCRIRTPYVYKVGEEVIININGGYRHGVVVWNKEIETGIRFVRPKHPVLEVRNKLRPEEQQRIQELAASGKTRELLKFVNGLLATLLVIAVIN